MNMELDIAQEKKLHLDGILQDHQICKNCTYY